MPTRETWQLIELTFSLSLYLTLLAICAATEAHWFIALVTPIFITGFYLEIRDMNATAKEKARIDSQKSTRSHYYNIWYRPADSTRIQYLANKIREAKKKIHRR